jgi:hypothetical protein
MSYRTSQTDAPEPNEGSRIESGAPVHVMTKDWIIPVLIKEFLLLRRTAQEETANLPCPPLVDRG